MLLEVLLELSAFEIWQKALGELQAQVTRANFNTWLRNSHGVSVEDGVFVVGTSNAFVAEWLTKRLHSLVRKTVTHVAGQELDVRFQVHDLPGPQNNIQARAGYADGGACEAERLRATLDDDDFTGWYGGPMFKRGPIGRLRIGAGFLPERIGGLYLHSTGWSISDGPIRLDMVQTPDWESLFERK